MRRCLGIYPKYGASGSKSGGIEAGGESGGESGGARGTQPVERNCLRQPYCVAQPSRIVVKTEDWLFKTDD